MRPRRFGEVTGKANQLAAFGANKSTYSIIVEKNKESVTDFLGSKHMPYTTTL